jgi:hypothetical protein
MRRLRPADQPRSASASAKFIDRGHCRFTQARIICQTETIVRGKVYEASAVNFYLWPLRTADFPKMAIQRRRTERLQLLFEEILHRKRLNCDRNQLRIKK